MNESRLVHGDKYDYSKVEYVNNHTKVCIVCPKHGEFWQTPKAHLNGQGCPKCCVSPYESYCLNKLLNYFLQNDIFSEYNKDKRYPFKCDFYIKSLDLFVELNAHWTHGGHWFNENDGNDLKRLSELEEKSQKSKYYKNAVNVWINRDVLKRKTAAKNNLNYVVLWNKEDIDNWFNEGCPIRKDWK